MQRLLIAHAEDQERHRPWLCFLQVRHGHMLVDAGNHERAEDLLVTSSSKLEEFIEESRNHDRHSLRSHDFIIRKTEDYLDLAYRNLAKLSRQLGNESAAQDWSIKLDRLRQ